jgi:hypothetical protein
MKNLSKIAIAMFTVVAAGGLAIAGEKADDKKMEMPKPPQEIADMVKSMGGNWKCEGTFTGMGQTMKYTSTVKGKTELGGFWVHETVDIKPADKKAMPGDWVAEAYMTFDPTSKKWRRVEVMNDGGMYMGTSDGMKDGKLEMVGDTYGPHGQGMMKINIDATDMKKGMHITGQMSMDKGKTWTPLLEETCKK